MSIFSSEYIQPILCAVVATCNLTEWRFAVENFENIAQNYFGVLIPVSLTGKRNLRDETVQLVLKLAPVDERYRVSGAITQMFAREIFVYTTLLEKYQEFQKNYALSSQYIAPKCYYVCKEYCKEVIALQNMCEIGYKPYTHASVLDVEHINISVVSLSKFHALSFILKDKEPKLYEKVTEICIPLTENNNKRFIEILIDRLTKAVTHFLNTEYVPLLELLKQNCAKFVEATATSVNQTCICHGDIWKENILFKYKDSKPVAACLIDYQTTRICSPAFDLLYLIVSSTDTVLRREHFNGLLVAYYQMFTQVLDEGGLNSQQFYPMSMFENDLKVVAPACLIVANTALWLSSGLQEKGHVRSKNVCTTPEEKINAINKYKSILKGIIDDFYTYGYLCSDQ